MDMEYYMIFVTFIKDNICFVLKDEMFASTKYYLTQKIKESKNQYLILIEFLYVILYILLISKKEKEKMVIQLANEGKTTREIAKQVHISLKDIGKILRKILAVGKLFEMAPLRAMIFLDAWQIMESGLALM